MKQTILKLAGLFLLAFLLLGGSPKDVQAQTITIKCGNNVQGTLDTDTKTLVISGSGDMYTNNAKTFQSYYSQISNVVIKSGVTSVGANAFRSSAITSCTFEGAISIGKNAFRDSSLTSVTIPANSKIGVYAFRESELTSVVIGSGVTIGQSAFQKISSLTSCSFGNNVSIGDFAFTSTGLTSVVIASGDSIGKKAFYNCKSLTDVTISAGVTSIGNSCFRSATALTTVVIGPGVTVPIGDSAFRDDKALSNLTIGAGVPSIGASAFRYTYALTTVSIPSSVSVIGQYAFACSAVQYLSLSEGLSSIEQYAFSECGNLKELTLPASLLSIKTHAFGGANAQGKNTCAEVTFLSDTTTIEENAFGTGSILVANRSSTADLYYQNHPDSLYIIYIQYNITVTYDPCGGELGQRTRQVRSEVYYGALPEPQRSGYLFDGWYTDPTGGTEINSSDRITSSTDFTLYAHWTKISLAKCTKPSLRSIRRGRLKIQLSKKVSGAEVYEYRYSTKKSMKGAKTVTSSKWGYTLKGLKSGKKYYVQVRAACTDSTGNLVYGKWSTRASIRIK